MCTSSSVVHPKEPKHPETLISGFSLQMVLRAHCQTQWSNQRHVAAGDTIGPNEMSTVPLSLLNFRVFFRPFVPQQTLSLSEERVLYLVTKGAPVEAGTLVHDVLGIERLWMDAAG